MTEGQEWLDELLPYIDANHAFVDSFIRERMPLVKTVKPQGTYLSWLDVSRLEEKIGAKEMAVEETNKKWSRNGGRPRDWNVAVLEAEVDGPARVLDCGHREA